MSPSGAEVIRKIRSQVEEVDPSEVREHLGNGVVLVDVRESEEWDAGHIPGSLHRPYHGIRELPERLDPGRPIAAICGSGQRSAVAASLLKRFGAHEVIHVVDGGVPLWKREGWPTEA